jgi:hypothetical protein
MLYDGAPKANLGLSPSTPFRIWPNVTNNVGMLNLDNIINILEKVAQLCAKRPNIGTSGARWHGIFIRSDKIDGKEVIILETALDDHKIHIEDHTHFDIVLISRKAHYTALMTTQIECWQKKFYNKNLHTHIKDIFLFLPYHWLKNS